MKKRFLLFIIISILILIVTPFIFIFLDIKGISIYGVLAILIFVGTITYTFFGLAKLIVYTIYTIVISLLLIIFSDYELPIIMFATLLIVLNPLSNFEVYLEKRLNEQEILPIHINLFGSYHPFYEYRKKMNESYHFPQMKKLFTQTNYSRARQVAVALLSAIGFFLLINGLNGMAKTIDEFDFNNFFASTYGVLMVITLTIILYKKGFKSALRALIILIFPPIIYFIFVSDFSALTKYTIGSGVILLGLVISIMELIAYYQRVIFESYQYYDVDMQKEVYANALIETIAYNESFTLVGDYKIRCSLAQFNKQFQKILVYANIHRFIIIAYTVDHHHVNLMVHFHYKAQKKSQKFLTFLEALFENSILLKLSEDPNKEAYERDFFHKPAFIKARAVYLADLIKRLEIKSKVIISMICYFETDHDFMNFNQVYRAVKLNDITFGDYITARVDCEVANIDYVIENKIQDILIQLMIHRGHYVRLTMYYA